MRALPLSLAVFLLAAGTAGAQRLDGTFNIVSDDETIESFVGIVVDGTEFFVEGNVSGLGTDEDDVRIAFFTDSPTYVNSDDVQARVRQDQGSLLLFQIESEVLERTLSLGIEPTKCSIDGKVNVPKAKGSVTVRCSGDDIFAEISASQLASIQAAFANTKNVKIKVNSDGSKGSLVITLKGPISEPA